MKKIGSNKVKKVRVASGKFKPMKIGVFMLAFAAIGSILLIISHAAPNGCDTTGVIGTATNSVSVPEATTYKVWVRMQVPDTTNTNNTNGVRLEFAGASTQCFTVTTTNSAAVSGWQWINTDATAASTPHVTSSMATGTYTAKILGLKAGVKVDKVILLKSDSTCTPSNTRDTSTNPITEPGSNCTSSSPTVNLTSDAASVSSGASTTLRWTTTDATSCTASNGWTGSQNTSGNASTGALTAAKTYVLTCNGPGGTANDSVTVNVTAAANPTVTLSANPTSVTSGAASTLTWTATNATSCTLSSNGQSSAVAFTGTNSLSTGPLTATTTISISCAGTAGTTAANASTTITVGSVTVDNTPPTITMSLPGITVPSGATSVLVSNLKQVTWSPVASDASGIKTFTLTNNGTGVALTSGSYVFGGTPTQANNDYLLRAVAVDNATTPNTATAQLTVKLRHPDFNRSGKVDIFDLSPLLAKWNATDASSLPYDLDANGAIGISDLSRLLASYNSTQ